MLGELKRTILLNRKLGITAGVLVLVELLFLPVAYFSSPILNVPVRLDSPGVVKKSFFVSVPDQYTLYLSFDIRDREADTKYIESEGCTGSNDTVGNKKCPEVKWLIAVNGLPAPELASGVGRAGHGAGWSGDEYRVALAETPICFGPYFISAEILGSNPALQRFNPHLKLAAHPKLIYTWERFLYTIMLMGQVIILPALLICIVLLTDRLRSVK